MLQSLIFLSPLSGYLTIDFYLCLSYSGITGIAVPDFTERRNVKGLILLSRHIPDIVRIPVRTELF
nr:MAG TPA: hypothetical protein [Caudoviricetes sp.]